MKSVIKCMLAIVVISMPFIAQSQRHYKKANSEQEQNMSENQKQIIRLIFEQVFNDRKFELLDNLISDSYVGIQEKKGAEGFKAPILSVIKTFPDMQWHLEELISAGNKVMAKWTVTGTHTDTYLNKLATGKSVKVTGFGLYEFREAKLTKAEVLTDRFTLLEQIGATFK